MRDVFITGRGVLSPAGFDLGENWRRLQAGRPCLTLTDEWGFVGRVDDQVERALVVLRREKTWRLMDRAVLLGVLAARQCYREAGQPDAKDMAVIQGSSRGATSRLEEEHLRFLESGSVSVTSSPGTTAGVFASAVAQDLGAQGPSFSMSSACSTSLQSLGMALALIQSGGCRRAVAGGAESSLTPFTLTQLKRVGVLAKRPSALYPCQPGHSQRSGLVPGEGAACLLLDGAPQPGTSLVKVSGFGAATESTTATGISPDGVALQQAMEKALFQAGLDRDDVGLIVGHGAGTVKGDRAELTAYRQLFGANAPPVTFHKWLTGHMVGASGAFSAALATVHILTEEIPPLPYGEDEFLLGKSLRPLRHVLITALGFGGSAAALVLSKVDPFDSQSLGESRR